MALSKAKMKKVVEGVKKSLEAVLEDIESIQLKYPSFKAALHANLPDSVKTILKKYEEKNDADAVEEIMAKAIGELGGDDILNKFTEKIMGLDMSDIKEAVEYSMKRETYIKLIEQLSVMTKMDKSTLVLAMDYSKDVDERIGRVQSMLDSLNWKESEK